ncbi:hypothetical protein FQN51_009266 [Onygenales sp. PD_10]|nr:hypothetical protein FQN51_009266 [Onygenales sp. PD_10]
MPESRNPEFSHQEGEFHPGIHPSSSMEKHGHQMGRKATPADRAPDFHAKTMPPGTAPPDSTWQPRTAYQEPSGAATANETLGGADSRDVNKGLGQHAWGETSAELHHDGEAHRKHHGSGYEGVGASGTLRREDREQERSMRPAQQ